MQNLDTAPVNSLPLESMASDFIKIVIQRPEASRKLKAREIKTVFPSTWPHKPSAAPFLFAARAGNVPGTFSYTRFFNETGSFSYIDNRYTTAMTGVINVKDFEVSVGSKPFFFTHRFSPSPAWLEKKNS